ncbi:Acyl-coenzyme A thioesterase PaaI, contains HGG motif [Alteribacillus persepolensis]|uniref:Transcription factor FapR n=1 Tax=Alteribacillus persepolensis TaxID=568899 RepID=A0A1G7YJE1_9BACI|nr:transcription factor FapR [Alteribacillus persepolensis]SDG96661.1 Acyl-coenzyme A thioesterase PaaI, contains HGG motif [Alteribacillus persepolensis]
MKRSKRERQQQLKEKIANDPFITDETLADIFGVSVQTIRLDRLELSIPELRERIKHVAREHLDEVKALPLEEVIGEIVDLRLDEEAISILDIGKEHVFSRNGIARGHYLFAQANSLAVAIINDELALTSRANVHFTRQVKESERVIAKATVQETGKVKTVVEVASRVNQEIVFQGEFVMFRSHR